ncbi:MAG TPA: hypothetical protein VGF75_05090 [Candidatus Saccharimonadales bacterium]
MSDSNNTHPVDLTHEEIRALIISSQAMLQGMATEGSPRPPMLVSGHDKLVHTHNLLVDLGE